jgi:hypothetical protein
MFDPFNDESGDGTFQRVKYSGAPAPVDDNPAVARLLNGNFVAISSHELRRSRKRPVQNVHTSRFLFSLTTAFGHPQTHIGVVDQFGLVRLALNRFNESCKLDRMTKPYERFLGALDASEVVDRPFNLQPIGGVSTHCCLSSR